MFEKFTATARRTVVAAQEVAREVDAPRLTPAHLLVGLATTDDPAATALATHGADRAALLAGLASDGLDTAALAALGIDLDAVRAQADATFGTEALARAGGGTRRAGHLPFTRDAKKTLEIALREAIRLGHKRIEAGHILLAIIRLDNADGSALLRRCGVDPAALGADITARLGRSAAA